MNTQKFPSQTGVLRWSGAHEATKRDDVLVVKKDKEELSADARKRYPVGLYYYFKRDADRWFNLVMLCSRNLYEEQ